ncbi:hypothetical protein NQ314_020153 [Rhamnusium bicolor]|uniref:Uncharacterized protein n=1 Tax=Rhamnusium bicolor TaxID=1586634 RepID=A0AAV8WM01_9CUCU|nr:hypothetical protein NQ314_020153 [Rhamnusium bicolor]
MSLEKEPEHFNEEDLRAVRDYEEKVAFLHSERERYKKLLDAEFTKIATNLRDNIRKFNQKLKDCLEFKMRLDSGLNQENLKVNRVRWKHNERIKLYQKEEMIK